MKRFLDRFVGGPRNPGADTPAEADDEGFFATQFMERPEDFRSTSAWNARGLAVGAHALDPDADQVHARGRPRLPGAFACP